ncbi:MAG: aldo/keto reductase [Calditrichales bacterium]|nr:MAG: aldo/keto reductase [Calditrichales bacterium]
MDFKKFAGSDIDVSLLGFGAWGIGRSMWIGAKDKESKIALHRAIESGVNFFDSALVYGNGHSEKLLGEVEKEYGQPLFITSKIPSKRFEWPARDASTLDQSFPKDHIIQITERSLKNLNRDYLDLQQFHVWNDQWANQDEWKEAIRLLKEQGKVRYFGISINDHQPENGIEAGKSGLIDAYQVIFNLFDQSPIDKLFPFCEENKIAVIARVPFDEGGLTGNIGPDSTFPRGDFRNNYFRDDRKEKVWDRVQRIQADIAGEADSLPEAALRFIISYPAVTTVIPGMRSEAHLLSNVESIAKGSFSADMVKKLESHRWVRNYYI